MPSVPSQALAVSPDVPGTELLRDDERVALHRAGYGKRMGLGERLALLVVDMTWAFCGDDPTKEAGQAVLSHPHACGKVAWDAMGRIRSLVEAARAGSVPVIFTRKSTGAASAGRWQDKNFRQGEGGAGIHEIVPASGYRPDDLCVDKEAPSAFHGTSLVRTLVGLGVDSVIVAGTTTSGCVRATVVDAFSYNFKVAVASDGTFDRINASHRMSLFDMNLKYADVLSVADLIREIERKGASAASAQQAT